MSTASQFLPNLPPVSILSYLEQVQPERFDKKYTLLQQFRALQAKAWDILQEVERGNHSRRPELCALGPRYRRLRKDLLYMLSTHMALILEGMRQTSGDPLAGALDKSAKALSEGAKILESMDSGTLQKVFEQSGDFITAKKLLREQHGRKPEDWSAAAKLEALKLILDNATRYIPLPDGTDAFFKFYSQAIGAIIKGIAPIEERNRKLQLAKLQPEAIRGYKNLKTWEHWSRWIENRQEEGIPQGVVEDAFKLAWIGTYLDNNRSLTKELLADTTGERIARLCAEVKPSLEGTFPAPPQKPQDQAERAGLPPKPSQPKKTGREEFEPGPVEGVSPPESALSPEEADRRRRCHELTKEANEAQSKCEQKQDQVRAARRELDVVIQENLDALDRRGDELQRQAKEEDAKAVQGIEGQIKKLKGQIEKQGQALQEKRQTHDAWAQGESERLESLMGKWKDALKKSQAALDQDDQAFQKWKEARDGAAAGEDKAFDEMVRETRASDATSDQVYAAYEEYMRADKALEKAKAKRERELEKLDTGNADLKGQVRALEQDRDRKLAALQEKRKEELKRLRQALEEKKARPVRQKLRRLEQEAIEICDQARERRREQQRVCQRFEPLRTQREHAAAEALPGDHAQPSTRSLEPARPAEPAAAEPAGLGLREGNRWVPVALIAGGLIASACIIAAGWAVAKITRRPEPAAITGQVSVTPPPQPVQETVPALGAEAVLTPTLTPTPTPTLPPSPTPTEAPPSEPQDVVFKAADGQELVATYYPPPVCPSPLTLVYFPWVHGDKSDFEKLAALLPPDLAYGAFAITPRGCEGGCAGWDVDGWLLDYAAALKYAAQELPCAAQGPLVAVGPSVGGDGAIYACAQEEHCDGALAISAGGYLGVPFEEEVRAMVEQSKHVWSVSAEGDSKPAAWPYRDDFDYSTCRQIIFPGAEHGNQLFNSGTAEVIQDFIACATHSFDPAKCVPILAEEYVKECNAYLEQGRELLEIHEGDACTRGIRRLKLAVERSTAVLELQPRNAEACFCRGMSLRSLEEDLDGAIEDLECAVAGLEDDRRAQAEQALAELTERQAAPVAVSMGPVVCGEQLTDDGQIINPADTFPAGRTREVWCRWELIQPGNELTVVKWTRDDELVCQHHDQLEDGWEWTGSGWIADEEWIETGRWCVAVYAFDTKLTGGCFDIE